MSFCVFLVTGPRRSGKSMLVSCMIEEVCGGRPHYIRLAETSGSKRQPRVGYPVNTKMAVATATWVDYESARAFEVVPDVLTAVYRKDQSACVVIEADSTDRNLQNAYSYDHQIFLMPSPTCLEDVFRSESAVQDVLRSALQDTTLFATEMFGLSDSDGEAVGSGTGKKPITSSDSKDCDLQSLLRSPMGRSLALRAQCQPEYQSMVDNDLVVINTGLGGTGAVTDTAVCAIERLIEQACSSSNASRPEVYLCDLGDRDDPQRHKLFEQIRLRYPFHAASAGRRHKGS